MKQKIEEYLGTVMGVEETWDTFFARLERDGRVDVKTLVKIMAIILEELERREDAKAAEPVRQPEPEPKPATGKSAKPKQAVNQL